MFHLVKIDRGIQRSISKNSKNVKQRVKLVQLLTPCCLTHFSIVMLVVLIFPPHFGRQSCRHKCHPDIAANTGAKFDSCCVFDEQFNRCSSLCRETTIWTNTFIDLHVVSKRTATTWTQELQHLTWCACAHLMAIAQ